MREIIVKDQVNLSAGKILRICLDGIYFRLFRSLVTLTIIALAVAFMANMLMGGIISSSLYRGVERRAEEIRAFSRWLTMLSGEMQWDEMSRLLGQQGIHSNLAGEIEIWGNLSKPELTRLHNLSLTQRPFIRFFNSLSPGKRYILVNGKRGTEALAWLEDPESLESFQERMRQQRSLRIPGGEEGLRELLMERRECIPLWERVISGRQKALWALRELWGDIPPRQLLAEPPDDFQRVLAEAGFRWEETEIRSVMERAQQEHLIEKITGALRNVGLRRDLAERTGRPITMVDMDLVAGLNASRGGRDFLVSRLSAREIDLGMKPEELGEALTAYSERKRILNIAGFAERIGTGPFGFSTRLLWLIAVACVVCIVGIANAMLMSVMERFREIATMKCLGATDGFVLTLFILESCIQGLAGGILGVLLAAILSIPLSLARYGELIWGSFPGKDLLLAGGIGVATGVFLAGLASIYPAWFASRLAPMEAMRVE